MELAKGIQRGVRSKKGLNSCFLQHCPVPHFCGWLCHTVHTVARHPSHSVPSCLLCFFFLMWPRALGSVFQAYLWARYSYKLRSGCRDFSSEQEGCVRSSLTGQPYTWNLQDQKGSELDVHWWQMHSSHVHACRQQYVEYFETFARTEENIYCWSPSQPFCFLKKTLEAPSLIRMYLL